MLLRNFLIVLSYRKRQNIEEIIQQLHEEICNVRHEVISKPKWTLKLIALRCIDTTTADESIIQMVFYCKRLLNNSFIK